MKSHQAKLLTSDCIVYFETFKLKNINLNNLESILSEFKENAENDSVSYPRAEVIKNFETEGVEYIKYELDKSGSLIPSINDDEIVFVYNYTYSNSCFSIDLNNITETVQLKTYTFGSFDLIESFIQNGEELEFELEFSNNKSETNIGFLSNKNNELKSIDLSQPVNDVIDLVGK